MNEVLLYCLYAFIQAIIVARFVASDEDAVILPIAFMIAAPVVSLICIIVLFFSLIDFLVTAGRKP